MVMLCFSKGIPSAVNFCFIRDGTSSLFYQSEYAEIFNLPGRAIKGGGGTIIFCKQSSVLTLLSNLTAFF